MQEYGNSHSGHASVGASLYLYASLPFYSWSYVNFSMIMPFFGDLRMWEWMAVLIVFVRAPWVFALRMRRLCREVWCMFRRVRPNFI